MALFNFDFRTRRADKAKADAIARARAGFVDSVSRLQGLPTAPAPLDGITDETGGAAQEDANIERLVRNEQASAAADAARAGVLRDLSGSLFDANAAGVDTKPVIETMDLLRRRQAIEAAERKTR